MRENGVVKRIISNNLVEVELERLAACKKCKGCGVSSKDQRSFTIEAINDIDARPTDFVELEVPTQQVLSISTLVFLAPVLIMFIGYAFGYYLGNLLGYSDYVHFLGGFFVVFFCLIFFIALPIYDRYIKKNRPASARVIKIIN